MDKDLSKNLNFFREKNNIEEVIRILLIEKNNNPKNLDVLFQLAGAYRYLGNFVSALSNYDEILSYDESDKILTKNFNVKQLKQMLKFYGIHKEI